MTTTFKTPTICKYPECKSVARKSWALVNICTEHHEEIRLETLRYYANRMPYSQRENYLKIAGLIKEITPLYAQTVTKNGVVRSMDGGDGH